MIRLHRQSDGAYKEMEDKEYSKFKDVWLKSGWRTLKEGEEVETKKEVVSKPKPTPIPPAKEVLEIERIDEVEVEEYSKENKVFETKKEIATKKK